MRFDPERHHRQSVRLRGYNYAQPGAYFVTLCTQNHKCLFGQVIEGEMRLSDAGRMVQKWWLELAHKFARVESDANIVMPNHFHGIILIVARVGADLGVRPHGLSHIVRWFKTMTTNKYIRGVREQGWPAFREKLWQRNYYERIIRDEEELNGFRQYIVDNPMQWEMDQENPRHTEGDECGNAG